MRRLTKSSWWVRSFLALLFGLLPLACAQDSSSPPAKEKEVPADAFLRRGSNEFGLWSGYSPASFKLVGQTEDRKLFLLNLQYARTLFATTPFTFKYTAEIVPVALQSQPTEIQLINGNNVINRAATVYGAGASPIGFQGNFGRKAIQPFTNGSVGFLYFRQQVPVIDSSQFNYTITIGFGAQYFRRSGKTFSFGWKYDHISNKGQANRNPGIDSSVFYAGFSVVRLGRR